MKRSQTIQIEDLQNLLSKGSIEEMSQEQIQNISGGGFNIHIDIDPHHDPHCPPEDKHPDYDPCYPCPPDKH
jgi:hypothetical protein